MINKYLPSKSQYVTAGTILFGVSFLFYIFHHEVYYDAHTYVYMIAPVYEQQGIFASHPFIELRTYFYPYVLSVLRQVSKMTLLPISLLAWLFESLIYFAATVCLTKLISRTHPKLAVISLFLMCANIYLMPYFAVTLTDALCTTVIIFWVAAIIDLHQELYVRKDLAQAYPITLIALFLAGIVLVIRPAGIWISFASAAMLLYFLPQMLRIKREGKELKINIPLMVIIAIIAYFLPLLPQIYINFLHFGKLSAFPNTDLGQFQLAAGIQYLKYATYVAGPDPQMLYPNPLLQMIQTEPTANPLLWYFKNPLAGFGTIILKFIGAFDFDYIIPHNTSLRPWYRWVTGFLSLSILYFGLWGMFAYAFSKTKKTFFFGPSCFPLICLVAWAPVALLSAYEARFGFPMLILFLIFSADRILHIQQIHRAKQYQSLAIYIFAISVLLLVAGYIAKQNSLLQ